MLQIDYHSVARGIVGLPTGDGVAAASTRTASLPSSGGSNLVGTACAPRPFCVLGLHAWMQHECVRLSRA